MAGRRTTPRVEAAAVRRYNMAAIRRRYQRLGKVWHISIPLHPSFASVSKDARVWAEAWVGLRRASVSRRQLRLGGGGIRRHTGSISRLGTGVPRTSGAGSHLFETPTT